MSYQNKSKATGLKQKEKKFNQTLFVLLVSFLHMEVQQNTELNVLNVYQNITYFPKSIFFLVGFGSILNGIE